MLKKFEFAIAVLALIALVMKIFLIPFGGVLTVLSISILICIYFYTGTVIFNDIPVKDLFKSGNRRKVYFSPTYFTSITLSILLTGILFKIQQWPMHASLLGAGLIMFVITYSWLLFKFRDTPIFKRIRLRLQIIAGVGLFFFILPEAQLVEFQFRQHPAYVQAYKDMIANPGNEEMRSKWSDELDKVYGIGHSDEM